MTFNFRDIQFIGVDGEPIPYSGSNIDLAKNLYNLANTLVTNQFVMNLYKSIPFEINHDEIKEIIPFIEMSIATYHIRTAIVEYLKNLK